MLGQVVNACLVLYKTAKLFSLTKCMTTWIGSFGTVLPVFHFTPFQTIIGINFPKT